MKRKHNKLPIVENDLKDIPPEILLEIIYHFEYVYPWDLIHFIEFKLKNVCKSWELMIKNNIKYICKYFGIGLVHYASAMNNSDEIMRLNLKENYSLRAPDITGYSPAYYAVGNGASNSVTHLKIAHALTTRNTIHKQLYDLLPADKKKNYYIRKILLEDELKRPSFGLNITIKSNFIGLSLGEIKTQILEKMSIGRNFFEGDAFKSFLWHYDNNLLTDSEYNTFMIYVYKNWLVYTYWEMLYDNKYADLISTCVKYKINFNSCGENGMSFLHKAILNKESGAIKFLLSQPDIDINYASIKYGTALIFAINNGIDVIDLLLDNNADPYLKCKHMNKGKEIMHTAPITLMINKNKPELLELIIKKDGKEILKHDDVIYASILFNSIECLKILLNIFDVNRMPLIEFAIRNKKLECIKLLIESGAILIQKNSLKLTLAHIAINCNFPECLEILLKYIKNINTELLFFAINKNQLSCIQVLIDSGTNLTIKNTNTIYNMITPLIYASSINRIDCVKLLLKFKANINARGDILIQKIVKDKYVQEIKYIQCTALHIATCYHHAEIVKLLISEGADRELMTTYQVSIFEDGLVPIISKIDLNIQDIHKSAYYGSALF